MNNSLVEKLAVQSLVEHGGELIFSKERFAELIVRECAGVVDLHEPLNTHTKRYSQLIREHFGVEQ